MKAVKRQALDRYRDRERGPGRGGNLVEEANVAQGGPLRGRDGQRRDKRKEESVENREAEVDGPAPASFGRNRGFRNENLERGEDGEGAPKG